MTTVTHPQHEEPTLAGQGPVQHPDNPADPVPAAQMAYVEQTMARLLLAEASGAVPSGVLRFTAHGREYHLLADPAHPRTARSRVPGRRLAHKGGPCHVGPALYVDAHRCAMVHVVMDDYAAHMVYDARWLPQLHDLVRLYGQLADTADQWPAWRLLTLLPHEGAPGARALLPHEVVAVNALRSGRSVASVVADDAIWSLA